MLLDNHQSAYRPNHSMETLLTNLTDDVLQQMDNGNVIALVQLDMSSAFDTVEQGMLLNQLHSLGVCGTALSWFGPYLTNRIQCVGISDAMSQGSVGGPLLFSLHLQPGHTTSDTTVTQMTYSCMCLFHQPVLQCHG